VLGLNYSSHIADKNKTLKQLCPIQMAYWAKKFVPILTRAAY